MKEDKIVAIIPARGGSKGIPRKNLKLFDGKPLISYIINEAKKSKMIDRVIVSTDDKKIAEVSKVYGAEVPFMRPKKISGDNASSLLALQHAINYLEKVENYYPNIIVLLFPTSPLLNSETIDNALTKMKDTDNDTIISVSEDYKHYWKKKGKNIELFYPKGERVVRQKQIPLFKETGAIYIATRDVIMDLNNFFGKNVGYVLMDEHLNVDIDTPYDFQIAEFIKKKGKEKQKLIISINERKIGSGLPTFIIAEAGVNHNGDFEIAKKMIEVAKNSGADAITFQHIVGERLNSSEVKSKLTVNDWKKWELNDKQINELCMLMKQSGLHYSICVTDEESLDQMVSFGISFIKIVSGDLTNIPFLKHCARKKLPILLSTGGSTLEEIYAAINSIEEEGNDQIIIYHTNSSYPTPANDVHLNIIKTLKSEFRYPVGFCDHSAEILTSVIAAAKGANVIEKHFSLDRSKKGPDYEVSLHPEELTQMVKEVRFVEEILGSHERKLLESERETIKLARRSVVSKNEIFKGQIISENDLIIKRPGTGIPPKDIGYVIGKKARCDIKKDILINKNMLVD